MNSKVESILLDFITVYLHDRKESENEQVISEELKRLYAACDVNGTMLAGESDYQG